MIRMFTKVIRVITKVIAAIVVLVMVIDFTGNILSADKKDKDKQSLIAEFKSSQHPENSKEISYQEKVFKGPLYSAEYQYNLTDEEVENYYDNELKKHGWEKENRRTAVPSIFFSYVKNKNIINISKKKGSNIWEVELHYQIYK